MPSPAVELNAEEKEDLTEEAFDDFPSEDEVEGAVDADDEEAEEVETGGETLDDDPAEGDGSSTNGTDEGAEARTDSGPKGEKKTPDQDPKTGKFLPKDGKAGEAAAGEKKEEPAKPQWERFAVNMDGKAVPIAEATLTRVNGHHMLAIKDADFPRFQQRMSKAVLADQMWRGLQDAVSELEEARAIEAEGPKSKGDMEIEADTVLEFLKGKVQLEDGTVTTRMALVASAEQLAWLADRVKMKQLEHKSAYETERKTFVDKRAEDRATKAAEGEEPETQLRGIGSILMDMANEASEFPQEVKALFKGATQEEIKGIFADLVPIRRSVFWKEGKEWFSNTELILNTAKASLARLRATTPAKAGTTVSTSDKTKRAERLNKGSTTTSLKTRRTPLNPGKTGTTEKKPEGEQRENSHTRAQKAEAKYRQTTRSFMNNPGFDIDDEED